MNIKLKNECYASITLHNKTNVFGQKKGRKKSIFQSHRKHP